jgi:hypothetical protein
MDVTAQQPFCLAQNHLVLASDLNQNQHRAWGMGLPCR